jgi:ribonuclease P protein component
VIWRIRERSAFERLRREGVRIRPLTTSPTVGEAHRRRSLWCSYLPDTDSTPPRVAFAIGRKVGPAVVRNRLRRQIRAVLNEQQQLDHLTAGSYLFGAHPSVADLAFGELRDEVLELLHAVPSAGGRDER